MPTVTINGPSLGTQLQAILLADDIQPGSDPSYQLCKLLFLFHPLGSKIVEKPIELAQSQERNIAVGDAPDQVLAEFKRIWNEIKADDNIFNTAALGRTYGIASIAMLIDGQANETALDLETLYKANISFNCYDPLNTAGSLVLNQNPLAMDFQHAMEISVSGSTFHKSRTCVFMNERPIYISYTSSAFGFVGRSVYQRALFPLKSFIQTMVADDMVARKVGVLIAMMKQAGSVVDAAMQWAFGLKRNVVKEAETNNVISISVDESIESLNLQNLDGPLKIVRQNILENIASAVPMPAKLMTEEAFAASFSEGSEDAKQIARFVDRVRLQLTPLYAYFDRIVMHRAWNPEFYKTIQKLYPEEYGAMKFEQAFYEWKNAFSAVWPSLLKEPDSELSKIEKVKLEGITALVELLMPFCKEDNKKTLIMWAADNFNTYKQLFENPLELNYEEGFETPQPEGFGAGEDGNAGDGESENDKPPPKKDDNDNDKRADAAVLEFGTKLDKLLEVARKKIAA